MNKSRNINNDDNSQTVSSLTDSKTVLQALALINESNRYKMELTTNGVVITDAIKFVQRNKEKLAMSKEGKTESDEHDYNKDRDQLEKRMKQENAMNRLEQQIRFFEPSIIKPQY